MAILSSVHPKILENIKRLNQRQTNSIVKREREWGDKQENEHLFVFVLCWLHFTTLIQHIIQVLRTSRRAPVADRF